MRQHVNIDVKVRTLGKHVCSINGFEMVKVTDEIYDQMGAIITDAILQAGINYDNVVAPRVKCLREKYPRARTTTGFLQLCGKTDPKVLLKWKGDEKPRRIIQVTKFFKKEDIQVKADLCEWIQKPGNPERLKQLKGIGDKTVDYFKILVGIQTSAIDRHLMNFLKEAGIEASGYEEAQKIIDKTADSMGENRRDFDHSIWTYMSGRKAKSCTD